ncbi:hypothetical protein ACP4OV_016026 [Aristida adscensionis]
MEGNNGRLPEITVGGDPTVAPASGGSVLREAKLPVREPTTPGSPSPATVWRGGSDGTALPGWKLDSLCGDSGLPPAMKGGFLCF